MYYITVSFEDVNAVFGIIKGYRNFINLSSALNRVSTDSEIK